MGAGLFYKDFKMGAGESPIDGQEVTFGYTAYNEAGGFIDSTYRQGRNASTQLGINGLIPGKSSLHLFPMTMYMWPTAYAPHTASPPVDLLLSPSTWPRPTSSRVQ